MKQNPSPTMFIGAVKWFDNNKGFGILALPLGEELFLHIRGFKGPQPELVKANEVIIGDKKPNPKRDGYVAQNCRALVGHPDDWEAVVFSLLGKSDKVRLPDARRKEQNHSLMELAAKQVLQGKDLDSIFTMVTSCFNNTFDPSLFMLYATFLEKNITRHLERESAIVLLSRIFGHFGSHISHGILFRVWKAGKFRYIGFDQQGDYEIPEDVLNLNATEIGYEELLRINEYSFGAAFCADFVNALLDGADTMDRKEIDALTPYFDFLEKNDREYWKNIVST